ncbi:hypothetical protein ACIQWR_19615 [Streptomyces sp. NPDC098789]|uniref:hypothetical protein n=1 Tax=Streptomyces sp. NPDC098789 TaxID=3366098 RepID=UPI00380EDB64
MPTTAVFRKGIETMRRTTARSARTTAATAMATALAAAALLTGCGTTITTGEGGGGGGAGSSADRGAPACPSPAPGPETGQPAPTVIDGTPANTPEGISLSQAVGEQGRGAFADVYSTHVTDAPPGRVTLCVTDLARGRRLVEAAHRADPQADPARADLYLARFTRKTLVAATQRISRLRDALPVHSVRPSRDAGGVTVETSVEGVASAEFKSRLERAAGGGIPVTLVVGSPAQAMIGEVPPPGMTAAPR